MRSSGEVGSVSNRNLWIGRVFTGLAMLFLLLDAVGKVTRAGPAVEATVELGYPESAVAGIGLALLTCVLLHLVPQTSVLGAILLTGYLGGAVAAQVRLDNPLFSHVLFPVYLGVLIWGGLLLREDRVRALLPWSTSKPLVRHLEQSAGKRAPAGN